MDKIIIHPLPTKHSLDYEHLVQLVEYLLKLGNKSVNPYLWGCDRTGYFCHLDSDFGFSEIEKHFIFPSSIDINRNDKVIFCGETYTTIRLNMKK